MKSQNTNMFVIVDSIVIAIALNYRRHVELSKIFSKKNQKKTYYF